MGVILTKHVVFVWMEGIAYLSTQRTLWHWPSQLSHLLRAGKQSLEKYPNDLFRCENVSLTLPWCVSIAPEQIEMTR